MSVALSASIAVPIANKALRLTFTATDGNFVRVWCTAAPLGSKLRTALDKDASARVHAFDVDSGKAKDYTFEKSGAYQFVAQEYKKGAAAYGGGYQFAPDTAPSETLLSETSIPLYIAAGLKAQLGAGGDTADLILYVADVLIQPTTLAVHGIATPAIQKPKTDKAATAATSADVLATLAALSGTSATLSLGSLSAIATDLIDKFNAHTFSSTFHSVADHSNTIASDFRNPTTADALQRSLAALLKSLSNHIRNDDPAATPPGTGTGLWHQGAGTGHGIVDWASLPLFTSSASISTHLRALADCWRCFEQHRPNAVVHAAPDNVNGALPLPALLSVHELFLAQIAKLSPDAPLTDNSAKTLLVHGAGFEEI